MEVEFYLLAISLLFFASIFSDRIGHRFGVPALFVFLVVGMVFGQEGLGLSFNSTGGAEAIGSVALCVILFTGGMGTKMSNVRMVLGPGACLATVGVILTTIITGLFVWGVFDWFDTLITLSLPTAMLVAATMSSTDSASVFSVLRTRGIRFKHHLGETLELESGANDPMAFVLVSTLIGIVTGQEIHSAADINWLGIVQTVFIQLLVGLAIGYMGGQFMLWVLRRVRLATESLYPIMVLSACIFIFSVSHYMLGNPFLAVYVGGLIIGNSRFTRKRQTKSFFDGLNWLCQLAMFLVLGLMVRPSHLLQWHILMPCVLISIAMIFVARPIAVALSLYPYRNQYSMRDLGLISWVGLKGAVPIIFGIQCMAAGVPYADMFFDLIFLCTLFSLLIQGTTIGSVAQRLQLAVAQKQQHRLEHFDLDLPEEIEASTSEIVITADMLASGNTLSRVTLPHHCLAIIVRRDEEYFVPKGNSVLRTGDILLTISDDDTNAAQQLTAEEQEEETWERRFSIKTTILWLKKLFS